LLFYTRGYITFIEVRKVTTLVSTTTNTTTTVRTTTIVVAAAIPTTTVYLVKFGLLCSSCQVAEV